MAFGTNATISSGTPSRPASMSSGTDSYSLYETGNETYSSAIPCTQAGGVSLGENLGYTGAETSTVTTTETTSFTSTQAVTTALGTNGTISSGSAGDSLYETGNDSTKSTGTGTNVRHYAYGGGDV